MGSNNGHITQDDAVKHFFKIFGWFIAAMVAWTPVVAGQKSVAAVSNASIHLIEAAIGFAAVCTLAAALISMLHQRLKR